MQRRELILRRELRYMVDKLEKAASCLCRANKMRNKSKKKSTPQAYTLTKYLLYHINHFYQILVERRHFYDLVFSRLRNLYFKYREDSVPIIHKLRRTDGTPPGDGFCLARVPGASRAHLRLNTLFKNSLPDIILSTRGYYHIIGEPI